MVTGAATSFVAASSSALDNNSDDATAGTDDGAGGGVSSLVVVEAGTAGACWSSVFSMAASDTRTGSLAATLSLVEEFLSTSLSVTTFVGGGGMEEASFISTLSGGIAVSEGGFVDDDDSSIFLGNDSWIGVLSFVVALASLALFSAAGWGADSVR